MSKEVVTTRYLFSALGGLLAALLAAAAAWGSFVYAQAADAGRSGAEAAARVNTRVDELAKVVADNQRAQARATAEIQSDIRALSLQMVTGRQPASLMMPASADGGGGP